MDAITFVDFSTEGMAPIVLSQYFTMSGAYISCENSPDLQELPDFFEVVRSTVQNFLTVILTCKKP